MQYPAARSRWLADPHAKSTPREGQRAQRGGPTAVPRGACQSFRAQQGKTLPAGNDGSKGQVPEKNVQNLINNQGEEVCE